MKCVAVFILILGSVSYAQDHPRTGLVHNTSEVASIQYDCKLVGSELHCDMNQTFVRQELKEADLPNKKTELIAQISGEERNTKVFQQTCKELTDGLAQIEGILKKPDNQLTPQEREGKAKISKHSLDKMRAMVGVFEEHCKKLTTSSREALASHMLLDQTKTCRIGSNGWKEVFVRSKGIEAGNVGVSNTWVTKAEPSGACGVLLANRWEIDTSESARKFKFWNYIARKVVTNPAGETFLGMKCSELDESTYRYVWQSQEIGLDCRTVKLSPY
jgi:hypothetical protein